MAYSTGSASSITALIDAIRVFAVANGWTQADDGTYNFTFTGSETQTSPGPIASASGDQSLQQSSGTVTAKRSVLSKGGVYWQIFGYLATGYKNQVLGTNAYIECWCSDNYASGTNNAHTFTHLVKSGYLGALSQTFATYHLFTNSTGDYIHVVIEETAGQFRHFSIGNVKKYGTWTGGQYVQASHWAEHTFPSDFSSAMRLPFGASGQEYAFSFDKPANVHRADIDTLTGNWVYLTTTTSSPTPGRFGPASYSNNALDRRGNGGGGAVGTNNDLGGALFYDQSPMGWNGLAPLLPLYVTCTRNGSVNNWSMLGEFMDVRYMNMSNFAPGDEFTIGSDTWKVFPIFAKTYSTGAHAVSYDHALAYKKIP